VSLSRTVFLSEFQIAGAVQRKARFQPDNNYFMGIMLAKQYTDINCDSMRDYQF